MPQIKVEIILPLCYNDKTPIERYKFIELYDELIERFAGYTIISSLTGSWKNPETGRVYKDEESVGLYIICEDSTTNVEFFTHLKERLKKKFGQEDVMMFSTKIDTF